MHAHPNKIYFYLNRNLGLLYASQVIISAAKAFFSLFVPIYLYKELLFPLWLVILIYGLQILLYGLNIHFGYKLALRFGVKKVFATGVMLNAIAIIFLLLTKNNPLLIIPFSIFLILHWMLYYPASSIDEVIFTLKKARAREDSFIRALSLGVNALIPLASGVLILFFGFNISFIIAIILSLLSAIPILYSKDEHPVGDNYSLKSSLSFFKSYKNKKEFIAYIADGFKTGNLDLFWPIFIFIFIPNYAVLGGITTLVILVSIVLTLIIGQIIDKYGPQKFLKIGAYGEALSWGLKASLWLIAVVTSFHILLVSILNRLMSIVVGISMNKIVLDHADKKNTIVEFLFLRKFAHQMGSSLPFLVFALFAFFLKNPEQIIIISFILMGFASFTFPFILTKKTVGN